MSSDPSGLTCPAFSTSSENEHALRAVLLDADGDLGIDEIVLAEEVPEKPRDAAWCQPRHADVANEWN
jgi:hypothetical protein